MKAEEYQEQLKQDDLKSFLQEYPEAISSFRKIGIVRMAWGWVAALLLSAWIVLTLWVSISSYNLNKVPLIALDLLFLLSVFVSFMEASPLTNRIKIMKLKVAYRGK